MSTDDAAKAFSSEEPTLLPAPAARKAEGAMPIDLASALAMTDGQLHDLGIDRSAVPRVVRTGR